MSIGEAVQKNILRSFGVDLEKGKKTGYYINTSENRKKGRVGQKYTKTIKSKVAMENIEGIADAVGNLYDWQNVSREYFHKDMDESKAKSLGDQITAMGSELKAAFENIDTSKRISWDDAPTMFWESSDSWDSASAGDLTDLKVIQREAVTWAKKYSK